MFQEELGWVHLQGWVGGELLDHVMWEGEVEESCLFVGKDGWFPELF